jgi:Ca2+-binding RTX toxin-like protein
MNGGAGNDYLNGRAGADAMEGGSGNDTYSIDNAADLVIENANEGKDSISTAILSIDLTRYANVENAVLTGVGNLNLTGSAIANTLTGNNGANSIEGGSGNDTLTGGSGGDTLSGRDGDDLLRGGKGVDQLSGGNGADVFLFKSAKEAGSLAAHDMISDFATGIDKLDLASIHSGQVFIGAGGFTNVAGQVRYSVATGLLYGDTNGDTVADYVIHLSNLPTITVTDLIL